MILRNLRIFYLYIHVYTCIQLTYKSHYRDLEVTWISHRFRHFLRYMRDMTHEIGDMTHEKGDMTHEIGDMTHEIGDMTHEIGDMTHEKGDMTHEIHLTYT